MNDWKRIPDSEEHLSRLMGRLVRIHLFPVGAGMCYAADAGEPWDGKFRWLSSRSVGGNCMVREVTPFGWEW